MNNLKRLTDYGQFDKGKAVDALRRRLEGETKGRRAEDKKGGRKDG